MLHVLLGGVILSLWASWASAADILIIARQDAPVTSLSRTEVEDIFLGRGGREIPLQPFDRQDEGLREGFYRAVADISLQRLRAYWAKRVFTGRGHPPKLLTDAELKQVMAANPYSISYVPAGQQPAGSKVLLVIESGDQP